MKTILLYGFLGKQFGKVHRYDVANPSEAIRAMCATIKGFRVALAEGGNFKILLSGKESLGIEDLSNPTSDKETIRIVPVAEGSGEAGRIVLGAALIIFAPQLAALTPSMGLAMGITAGTYVAMGMSLVLGGISQLLFAPPDPTGNTSREATENTPSYIFNGAVNTIAQGHPVPVCYGRLIVGSQVISAGISVESTEGSVTKLALIKDETATTVTGGTYTAVDSSTFISNISVNSSNHTFVNVTPETPEALDFSAPGSTVEYNVSSTGVYTFSKLLADNSLFSDSSVHFHYYYRGA